MIRLAALGAIALLAGSGFGGDLDLLQQQLPQIHPHVDVQSFDAAADQLRSELGDYHAGDDVEFAGEHGPGFIVIRQLASDFAVLAFLVPAEAAVGDGLRADVLEGA